MFDDHKVVSIIVFNALTNIAVCKVVLIITTKSENVI